MARYVQQTPGRLVVLLAVAVVLCLATGIAAALDIGHRRATLTAVTERGSRLMAAAVDLYGSLSDADATSAGAFLAIQPEPADLRKRYDTDVAKAADALSRAAAGARIGDAGDGGASATLVAQMSRQLPVYTDLVAMARLYNKLRLPLGAAYLREASSMIQDTMLRAAKRLYEEQSRLLSAAQADAARTPWPVLGLGGLAVAWLAAVQVYLTRRTNRLVNVGLLAAAAATAAALGWFWVASVSAAGHSAASRRDGTAQVEALAAARIAGLRARSDEALTLVAQGNGKPYEDHFVTTMGELAGPDGLLSRTRAQIRDTDTRPLIERAVTAADAWNTRHGELRSADDSGHYSQAVQLATDGTLESTAGRFTSLDSALDTAIAHARGRLNAQANLARSALRGVDAGVAALALLAAALAAAGMAPRLREYR
jgi:hypothetical protein